MDYNSNPGLNPDFYFNFNLNITLIPNVNLVTKFYAVGKFAYFLFVP